MSPASNSSHSHILFAVKERNVPLPLLNLFRGVSYCSPGGLQLGLGCALWCSLLKGQFNSILRTIFLVQSSSISALYSLSLVLIPACLFPADVTKVKPQRALSLNVPPQILLSNPADPLSNPQLLSAHCWYSGGIAALLWYCKNYIILNPFAT